MPKPPRTEVLPLPNGSYAKLARGPMFRLRLVSLGDAEYRLFLTLHHIIFDGVSLYRVLLPELLALYEAFTQNESPQLSELPIQ